MQQRSEQQDGISMQALLRSLIGVACVGVVLSLLWYFADVVIYILVSAVLAIMFRPLVHRLSTISIRGWIIPRSVAALISLFAIWFIFGALFSAIVPLIFSKVHQLTSLDLTSVLSSIEEPVLYVQHYIQHLFSLPESNFSFSDSLISWFGQYFDIQMVNSAFSSVMGIVTSSLISFFSISFITFFFLKDDNLFFNMVASIFPTRYNESVMRALSSISYLLSRYFVGLLCESAIIAVLVCLSMMCWGMSTRDALFMGVVMGVLNVIPYAGPFLGACFSLFLGVVTPIESLGIGYTVLVIALSLAVIKGADDFLLQPTLYSERVKAHPLEVFIVILMSGYVGGVVGMLLAIPSYTVIRVFAKEFFSHFSLVRKLTKEL